MITRDEAYELLKKYNEEDFHLHHGRMVEGAMRYFARKLGYEKEEEFLSKMASEGWHFVNLHKGLITKYEFDKGEPIDYVYQLDYVNKTEDTQSYHQLFLDAGWEEVFSWDGVYDGKWYYFRKLRYTCRSML